MMDVLLLGAAGFIGTNLTMLLASNEKNRVTLVDKKRGFFADISKMKYKNIKIIVSKLNERTDFERILHGQDVIYHLVSTTVPTTSNQHIAQELMANVVMTAKMLDACVKCGVKKVVFISSGGTVYGRAMTCPLKEDAATDPITSYGIQKITIERLLYLYQYMYGLDYRVIRLANPYGPYQRPNGVLGAVTTFTYKALKKERIIVYGDGSVVRDFIYIDDAIRAIVNIVKGEAEYRTFNIGCGHGVSIKQVLETIQSTLDIPMDIMYLPARKVDVPVNYLDITRYESIYGALDPIPLKNGIIKTAGFMREHYHL